MKAAPGRLDELEKRVEALEKALKNGVPDACPLCGQPLKVTDSRPHFDPSLGNRGVVLQKTACTACTYSGEKLIDPHGVLQGKR